RWSAVTATHSQDQWPVAAAADGKPNTGWAILPQTGKANHAVFEAEEPLGDEGEPITLVVALSQNYGSQHTLGKFRLSVTNAAKPVRAGNDLPAEVADVIKPAPAERTEEQRSRLAAFYRSIAPELAPVRKQLADLERQKAQIEASAPLLLISISM